MASATVINEGGADMANRFSAGRAAGDTLAWSRAAAGARMREAVAQLPESMRRVASYHFGWRDIKGQPAAGDMGKAVRPAFALLCAQAVGGDPQAAIPVAVAVELVHNFSLLQDDVMDRDLMRRHRPAAWTVFGAADAVLAGDALLALAFQCLAQGGMVLSGGGVQRLSRCVAELCHGQSLDISFEKRGHIEIGECRSMAAAKTAALFGCACSLGALAGGATAGQAQLLDDFGSHIGLAFQLVDDLLGIWGDPDKTGKPAHSDLISRKKSLPVTAALNSGTAPGREVAEFYRRQQQFEPAELPQIADLIERAGGREWARRAAAEEFTSAVNSLTAAACPADTTALRQLAETLLSRDN
jgi:geranylgeranyl diphosphate synthase type I